MARNSWLRKVLAGSREYPTFICTQPEHKLLGSIIIRTLCDSTLSEHKGLHRTRGQTNRRLREEALSFIFDDSEREWGFMWILNHLTDDPDMVASKVRHFIANGGSYDDYFEPCKKVF